jgi:hypothetical protein
MLIQQQQIAKGDYALGSFAFLYSAREITLTRSRGKRPTGRARSKWKDNIKMDFKEIGCCDVMDCIHLAQDGVQLRISAKVIMKFRVQ